MAVQEFYHASLQQGARGESFDAYHLFVGSVPLMADMARRAAQQDAFSYRDFLVGSTLFVADEDQSKTAMIWDGNWKMAPEFPKYCAEMSTLDQAAEAGYTKAIGMVVAGTTDKAKIAEVTDRMTNTLHPCSACIEKYDASDLVDDEFPVLSCGDTIDGYQLHSLGELKEFYATKVDDELLDERYFHATNNFNSWQERRLFVYDYLLSTAMAYRAEQTYTRAQLAHMALSAVLLDR